MKIDNISSVSSQVRVKNPNPNHEPVKISSGEKSHVKQEQPKQDNFPGEKLIIDAIEKSNRGLQMSNSSLQFSVHEGTKEIMVKVIDNVTKEVIREIPSEKILDMVAAMLERTGLFVDKKA